MKTLCPCLKTGTGKSSYIKAHLSGGMDRRKWLSMVFNFSAQTSAAMTQDIIDGKLDKRRKVGGVAGCRRERRLQLGGRGCVVGVWGLGCAGHCTCCQEEPKGWYRDGISRASYLWDSEQPVY